MARGHANVDCAACVESRVGAVHVGVRVPTTPPCKGVYVMSLPPAARATVEPRALYIHDGRTRSGSVLDGETERFVQATRIPKP